MAKDKLALGVKGSGFKADGVGCRMKAVGCKVQSLNVWVGR
jgi:hypothetical protein